jgi:hypothetical protein
MTRSLVRKGALAVAIVALATPLSAAIAYAAGSPPATPDNLALTSGNRLLHAHWTETSTGAITFTATAKATGHPTRKCVTRTHACTIVSLINGVSYDVTVVASNANGKSSPSTDVVGIPGVPSAPLSVHATAIKGGKAAVMWAPPISSGVSAISGYTATSSPGGLFCTTTGARHCTITGLTAGLKYTVSVVATNKYGSGPASKTFAFTAK